MFAIALHDRRVGRLLLIRDHLGIKPLYYTDTGAHLVWGSEIKAILASGLVERELNVDALGQFMSWEYVPGAGTLLNGIHKLKPGEMLELNQRTGKTSRRQYWDIPLQPDPDLTTPGEWADAVDAKLAECVRRQLVSDVPLGAFLSGGVDSSLIAASMDQPETFSIGFQDSTYNELPYSRAVADHLHTRHHIEIVSADAVDLFHQLLYLMDDPIGDFSIFPTYLVSQVARKHVTVALSGDGGDELFGGYETYVADRLARRYAHAPQWIRNSLIAPAIRRLRPRPA
jgi:asparagine synthase (glutamine-hydrolysing)